MIEGFEPKYTPLTEEQSSMFIKLIMSNEDIKLPDDNLPFPLQILNKRIEAMKLPITITNDAKMMALIMTGGNPGKMMVFLIDCLEQYEDRVVDKNVVCEKMYPWGFYEYESFIDYVDNYIKKGALKWSKIY